MDTKIIDVIGNESLGDAAVPQEVRVSIDYRIDCLEKRPSLRLTMMLDDPVAANVEQVNRSERKPKRFMFSSCHCVWVSGQAAGDG
jgi:hypothetical protein